MFRKCDRCQIEEVKFFNFDIKVNNPNANSRFEPDSLRYDMSASFCCTKCNTTVTVTSKFDANKGDTRTIINEIKTFLNRVSGD